MAWVCDACTLMNTSRMSNCEACGKPRADSALGGQTEKHFVSAVPVSSSVPVAGVVYAQPVTAPTNVVYVVNTPRYQRLGTVPTMILCPHCHTQIRTRTREYPSNFTHMVALVMCCVGCWPCCFVPYCVCNDVEHICPNCRGVVGVDEAQHR